MPAGLSWGWCSCRFALLSATGTAEAGGVLGAVGHKWVRSALLGICIPRTVIQPLPLSHCKAHVPHIVPAAQYQIVCVSSGFVLGIDVILQLVMEEQFLSYCLFCNHGTFHLQEIPFMKYRSHRIIDPTLGWEAPLPVSSTTVSDLSTAPRHAHPWLLHKPAQILAMLRF